MSPGNSSSPSMDEIDSIKQAITALEAQRPILGDAVVDAALAPLREKLAFLQPRAADRRPGASQLPGNDPSPSRTAQALRTVRYRYKWWPALKLDFLRCILSETNYCLGSGSLVVSRTNQVDLQAGKQGVGDRIWLEVKQKTTN